MKPKSELKRRDFLLSGSAIAFAPFILGKESVLAQLPKTTEGRRVVTGVNEKGKSVILRDGAVPDSARYDEPGKASGTDLWVEHRVPVSFKNANDPLIGYSPVTEPPDGGVTARIVTWQPGFSFPFHRTRTLDFIFIISGRLELLLDEGSTVLGPGDTAIQRGTNHGWRVVGNEPCMFAAVLISAVS